VLITGVTGFIGSRVAARWVARAGEVRGLVRRAVAIPGVDGHTTSCAFLEIYADWFAVEVAQREARSVYDHFRGRFATDRVRTELGYAPRRSLADAMDEIRRFLEARGVVPSG